MICTPHPIFAGDKIEKNEMGWACGAYGWGEGLYRVLAGKPEGKRPLGRPRHIWVDNIKMDLQEVWCGYMDLIGLAQDRDRWRTLVSAVMNLRVPWNAGNFLTSCKPVSFSRGTLYHGVSNWKLWAFGIPQCRKSNNSWICFLRGPEDDRLSRNMLPGHIYQCI